MASSYLIEQCSCRIPTAEKSYPGVHVSVTWDLQHVPLGLGWFLVYVFWKSFPDTFGFILKNY